MKKTSVIILAIGLLFTTSIASVNAANVEGEEVNFIVLEGQPYQDGGEYEGYTLFNPMLSKNTYLIDNDGAIVNMWESDHIQSLPAYLLEDGSLLRSSATSDYPLWYLVSGASGRIERFNWEGDLIWDFEYYGEDFCLHHDIEVLPNGNILMLAWEKKTLIEAFGAGVDIDLNMILLGGLIIDYVIEVNPTDNSIVWEWHLWDHLIQDEFPLRGNYGVVENHPELLDINFEGRKAEVTHCNSVEYNEELDQIMLTSRHLGEIFIIDHSTTTEHLLYRWGNPQNYGAGDESDQVLFGPHDARFIEEGCPGEGHVTIFNNGWERPGPKYSSVLEIELPSTDNDGNYDMAESASIEWSYTADNPTDFYSSMMSGAQRLPNGNTLVCSATQGWFFEVTSSNEIVWGYTNNYPVPLLNDVFRVQQYSSDYEGLNDLNPGGQQTLPSEAPEVEMEESTLPTYMPEITNTENSDVSEQSSSGISGTTPTSPSTTETRPTEPHQQPTSITPVTKVESSISR
jgi:hypothetical protein